MSLPGHFPFFRWIPLLACAAMAIAAAGCDGPRGRRNDFARSEPEIIEPEPTLYAPDPAADDDQAKTIGEWLRVTTEQAEIQTAEVDSRRQAEADVQSLFKRFEEGPPFLDPAERNLLLRHRGELREHLRRIAQGPIARKGPALAAVSLIYLGDLDHRTSLVRAFERGNKLTRLAILEAMAIARWSQEPETIKFREALSDPAVATLLRAQLEDNDPEILAAAIEACGALQTPGAKERFLRAASRLPPEKQPAVQFWLAATPLNAELLQFTLRQAPREVLPDTPFWNPAILAAFVRMATGDLQRHARVEARRLVALEGEREGEESRGLPARWELLRALGETATVDDLPWLEQWAHRGPAEVWQAVVRLSGPVGRQRLLDALSAGENRASAVRASGEVFRGSKDTEVMAALVRVGNTDHGLLYAVCDALYEVGGAEAIAQHRRMVRRLDPPQADSFLRKVEAVDLEALGRRAVELGLLTQDERRAALEAVKLQTEEEAERSGIVRLLDAAGRLVSIDVETASVPCRHDRLLAQFAERSQKQFRPTSLSEGLVRYGPDEEAEEYRVRFVSGLYLYNARLRNLGDWYDLGRLILVVNRVLSDGGGKERFVALVTDDGLATYVFGDPQKIAAAAREFHLQVDE